MPTPLTFLLQDLRVGGAERQAVALILGLPRERYELQVLCLRREGPLLSVLEEAGVAVDALPWRGGIDPEPVPALIEALRRHGSRLLHSWLFLPGVYGAMASTRLQIPRVDSSVRSYTRLLKWWQGPVERAALSQAAAVVANSQAVASTSRYLLPGRGRRLHVIYNGVDLERFDGLAPREQLRERFGFGRGERVVVMLARLDPRKDHRTLHSAARQLAARELPVRVVCVGSGPTEAQVRTLGAPLELWGQRSPQEAAEILRAADVSVLCTRRGAGEGLPNAVVESLAAGTPVVVTRGPGSDEALTQGDGGLLVPAGDPEALSAALARVLTDNALQAELARRGREAAQRRFAMDRMVREYAALYDRLL